MNEYDSPLIQRRRLVVEYGAVLAIAWLPAFLGATFDWLGLVHPASTLWGDLSNTVTFATDGSLILYLIWRRGGSFKEYGFVKPRVRDIAEGLATLLIMLVLSEVAAKFEVTLNRLPMARHAHVFHAQMPLWLAPVYYLMDGFFEETLWRSYSFTTLYKLFGRPVPAIVISSALFASYHIYQGWVPVLSIFCIGLAFACLYSFFKSIWPLILGHAAADFIFLVLIHMRHG